MVENQVSTLLLLLRDTPGRLDISVEKGIYMLLGGSFFVGAFQIWWWVCFEGIGP